MVSINPELIKGFRF